MAVKGKFNFKSTDAIDKIERMRQAYSQLEHQLEREHDFKIGRCYYWFGTTQTTGIEFDAYTCNVTLWRADLSENIFDVWHDGQFVWNEDKFIVYKQIVDGLVEEELL